MTQEIGYRTIVADPPWRYGSQRPASDTFHDFAYPAPDGIGDWLRQHREAAGLTLKTVAAHFPSRTGGLTGCVTNWEREFNRPTPEQWRKLRDVVGFDDRYDVVMTTVVSAQRKDPIARGHAARYYGTMALEDICALPVSDVAAESAHLWVWGVNGMIEEAYGVVRAWGFSPITLVTWCKPQPGVGAYLRNNTEHCIFASRGKPMAPENKAISTWYKWPRGTHSEKPDGFYDLVEQVSPGPYVEMFARRARFGWDYWGDQSLGTAELVS